MRALPLLLLASACGKDKSEAPPKLLDTGWFETTDTTCPDQYDGGAFSPKAGSSDWYWRDRPRGYTQTDNPEAYDAYLLDEQGNRLDTEMVWDSSGLTFTLEWDGWLQASTDYTLVATDCANRYEIPFTTSALGRPLTDGPESLQGRTFLLDLENAEWIEPPQLSSLISLYLNTPFLLAVKYVDVDQEQIDLLGAPGETNNLGLVSQAAGPVWDFPMADFSEQPFLDAYVDRIVLQYEFDSGIKDIPVEDFVLQATFSADGETLGGGVLSGLGDTRNLGSVLGDADNEAALCTMAEGLGVACVPCQDGEPYCLNLVARDLQGTLMPGVQLEDR